MTIIMIVLIGPNVLSSQPNIIIIKTFKTLSNGVRIIGVHSDVCLYTPKT